MRLAVGNDLVYDRQTNCYKYKDSGYGHGEELLVSSVEPLSELSRRCGTQT